MNPPIRGCSSTSATDHPAPASRAAAAMPLIPAPTTTASNRSTPEKLARSYDPAMALSALLQHAAEVAGDYRASLPDRPVQAPARSDALLERFGGPLPRTGTPPERVVDELVAAAEDGLMSTAGPRYFGFVVGGALPAATAADVLAAGWDQVAFNDALSPAAVAAQRAVSGWPLELPGLPPTATVGLVPGAQAGHTVGIPPGRHRGRRARGRVGPGRVQRRALPRRGGRRTRGVGVAARAARSAAHRHRRPGHRRAGGQHGGDRRGPPPRPAGRRVGRRTRRAAGRPAGADRRERGPPRHHRPRRAPARPRRGRDPSGGRRRQRGDRPGRPAPGAR